MDQSTRPWSASLTARLTRAYDHQTLEIIDYANGHLTRRFAGPSRPGSPAAGLDETARRDLLAELRAELADLTTDVDRGDLETFAMLLEGTLALSAA